MEQGQDRPHPLRHAGRGAQGQARGRLRAPLVAAGLILAATVAASPPAFDRTNAWEYLKAQTDFGPRPPGGEAHLKCRDWILERTKESADDARLQPFSHTWSQDGKRYEMWNVVGEQNWKEAKVRVVLMAHWDTRPTADMEPNEADRKKPILGANDGASGVAVLLEVMRAMKGLSGDLGIQYVFVDGEDLGPGIDEMFLGADHYANTLGKERRPDYGILLDMIGDQDLRVPMEAYSYHNAKEVTLALYSLAAKEGLGAFFPKVVGDPIQDDHLMLIRAGIPTVDLIDFTYEPWHTLRDTPEQCSPESLGKVGDLLLAWLRQTPVWRPTPK